MLKVSKKKADEILDYWLRNYPLMATEELGELIQAVSKVERSRRVPRTIHGHLEILEDDVRQNLVDELGDVAITITCLARRYMISDAEIQDRIDYKLNKKYDEE